MKNINRARAEYLDRFFETGKDDEEYIEELHKQTGEIIPLETFICFINELK